MEDLLSQNLDHLDPEGIAEMFIGAIDTAVDEWRVLMHYYHAPRIRENYVPMFRGSRLWGGQTKLSRAQLIADLDKFFEPGGLMDDMIDYLRSIGVSTPRGDLYRHYINRIANTDTSPMVDFWTRLRQYPPVLCRLVAKVDKTGRPNSKTTRPKTAQEIANAGGISVRDVLILSQSPNWNGTPIEVIHGYLEGCDLDFCNPKLMEKMRCYIKNNPRFTHLKKDPNYRSYWLPLVRIYYQSLKDGHADPIFKNAAKHSEESKDEEGDIDIYPREFDGEEKTESGGNR